MATIAGAGVLSVVMALTGAGTMGRAGSGTTAAVSTITGAGHSLKTTSFDLVVIDAWPGAGTVAGASNFFAQSNIFGAGTMSPSSSVTGTGLRLRGVAGNFAAASAVTGRCYSVNTFIGRLTGVSSVTGRSSCLVVGRGLMAGASVIGAVGDESTVANKELYAKTNGTWTMIFPVSSVIRDLDGGTW